MLAEDTLREGDLDGTLARLQDEVRKDPSNAKHRVFLFQLLVVLGQWDRAMTQLNVAGDLDPGTLAMVQTYREALQCEAFRGEVFAGRRSPLIFGDPGKWVALMVEALRLSAEGRYAESQGLRDQAFESAGASAGKIDDAPFEWIADADPRLGPVLEVIINGHYYWVPFQHIKDIQFDEPADLRDMVWTPAQFHWTNGGDAVGLVPTRYPDSQASEDPLIRMARKTDWSECGEGLYVGLGQRMLATDSAEYPLMDIRSIEFEAGDAEPMDG